VPCQDSAPPQILPPAEPFGLPLLPLLGLGPWSFYVRAVQGPSACYTYLFYLPPVEDLLPAVYFGVHRHFVVFLSSFFWFGTRLRIMADGCRRLFLSAFHLPPPLPTPLPLPGDRFLATTRLGADARTFGGTGLYLPCQDRCIRMVLLGSLLPLVTGVWCLFPGCGTLPPRFWTVWFPRLDWLGPHCWLRALNRYLRSYGFYTTIRLYWDGWYGLTPCFPILFYRWTWTFCRAGLVRRTDTDARFHLPPGGYLPLPLPPAPTGWVLDVCLPARL
jgi:hypothetical protein